MRGFIDCEMNTYYIVMTCMAVMAVVVFIVLPIACAYPFFQRYVVAGLTIGSVKG